MEECVRYLVKRESRGSTWGMEGLSAVGHGCSFFSWRHEKTTRIFTHRDIKSMILFGSFPPPVHATAVNNTSCADLCIVLACTGRVCHLTAAKVEILRRVSREQVANIKTHGTQLLLGHEEYLLSFSRQHCTYQTWYGITKIHRSSSLGSSFYLRFS